MGECLYRIDCSCDPDKVDGASSAFLLHPLFSRLSQLRCGMAGTMLIQEKVRSGTGAPWITMTIRLHRCCRVPRERGSARSRAYCEQLVSLPPSIKVATHRVSDPIVGRLEHA